MASFCAAKGTMSKTVSTALSSNTGSPTGNGPKVCSWNGDETPKSSEDVCLTLRAGQGGEGVGVAFGLDQEHNGDVELYGTLKAKENSGGFEGSVAQNLTVRRLTPRECERLQGFPDDWTLEKAEVELVGNEWQATGKVAKQADGPRYKQMGNAVTVNVAAWFGGRLANVEEAEAELQV
jgi:DNA (cytosine-5)-methyltransferase 1